MIRRDLFFLNAAFPEGGKHQGVFRFWFCLALLDYFFFKKTNRSSRK